MGRLPAEGGEPAAGGLVQDRGAYNAVVSLRPPGVVTYSSGNHGQALAYAAREYGVPCVVFAAEGMPEVKAEGIRTPFVFLGNIHPRLQLEVLDQVKGPLLVAADTMDYWIQGAPDELRKVLKRIDVLIINDSEARELSGEANLVKAARVLRAMGPCTVVIKRGENGVLTTCSGEDEFFAAPAMPLEEVFDPTGAGDTFAGGFMGSLAAAGKIDDAAIARAIIYGSTLASFAVEQFSLDRLLTLTQGEIKERFKHFKRLTHFDEA